jgi:peroxiredoxin Q/BCP
MLKPGDALPEFSLTAETGQPVTHTDISSGVVLLYFYPKDDTPGCTKQACAFRDGLDAFRERGTRIFGVSADDEASHAAFKQKFGLNFPLIADPEHTLCDACGVWGEQSWQGHTYEGIARTTFLLRDGVVAQVFENVDVTGHAERMLAAIG